MLTHEINTIPKETNRQLYARQDRKQDHGTAGTTRLKESFWDDKYDQRGPKSLDRYITDEAITEGLEEYLESMTESELDAESKLLLSDEELAQIEDELSNSEEYPVLDSYPEIAVEAHEDEADNKLLDLYPTVSVKSIDYEELMGATQSPDTLAVNALRHRRKLEERQYLDDGFDD